MVSQYYLRVMQHFGFKKGNMSKTKWQCVTIVCISFFITVHWHIDCKIWKYISTIFSNMIYIFAVIFSWMLTSVESSMFSSDIDVNNYIVIMMFNKLYRHKGEVEIILVVRKTRQNISPKAQPKVPPLKVFLGAILSGIFKNIKI